MYDVDNYDEIFEDRKYSEGLFSDIEDNKSALGGKTFFERLLQLLKISYSKLYPPRSSKDLADLHSRIISADITLHYKHCLIFYLLKDLSPSVHILPSLDADFADNVHLEKRFRTFIEGIWDLDHLQFESAVQHLCHPCIVQTFPDEILASLLRRRERSSGADGGREAGEREDVLPLAYFNCAAPPLEDAGVRLAFTKYLSALNVSETYYFIRTRPEHEQRFLLETLVEQTLTSPHSLSPAEARHASERAVELVGLPFDEEEGQWLEAYLTTGKGRLLIGAEDTVLMRKMATGRLAEVGREGGVKGKRLEGVNWEVLRAGVKSGLGSRSGDEGFAI